MGRALGLVYQALFNWVKSKREGPALRITSLYHP